MAPGVAAYPFFSPSFYPSPPPPLQPTSRALKLPSTQLFFSFIIQTASISDGRVARFLPRLVSEFALLVRWCTGPVRPRTYVPTSILFYPSQLLIRNMCDRRSTREGRDAVYRRYLATRDRTKSSSF